MSRPLLSIRTLIRAATLAAVLSTLAACGGGSSDTAATPPVAPNPAPAPPDSAPAEVVGVQTPDSVAVVTATNAD
jgi:hypothetical protein